MSKQLEVLEEPRLLYNANIDVVVKFKKEYKFSCFIEEWETIKERTWFPRGKCVIKRYFVPEAKIYIDPCHRLFLCQNVRSDRICMNDQEFWKDYSFGYKYVYNIGYIDCLMNVRDLKVIDEKEGK